MLLWTALVNVNSKFFGRTPLSWAAENGTEAVVKLLLESGQVDVDMRLSKKGCSSTPLSLAASNGQKGVVKLLLQAGQVEINCKDLCDQTPLSLAAMNGHTAVVKLLLATGEVDVDPKDFQDRTPLSHRCNEWPCGSGETATRNWKDGRGVGR